VFWSFPFAKDKTLNTRSILLAKNAIMMNVQRVDEWMNEVRFNIPFRNLGYFETVTSEDLFCGAFYNYGLCRAQLLILYKHSSNNDFTIHQ